MQTANYLVLGLATSVIKNEATTATPMPMAVAAKPPVNAPIKPLPVAPSIAPLASVAPKPKIGIDTPAPK